MKVLFKLLWILLIAGILEACNASGRLEYALECAATNKGELDEIKHNFPEGLAVDMESASIAQVCYLYQIPFISFRIISDTPGADKHFEQYQNFWGEMADRSFHVTETFLKALPNKL